MGDATLPVTVLLSTMTISPLLKRGTCTTMRTARRRNGVGKAIISDGNRPIVNTGIVVRNAAANAVASVSKIFVVGTGPKRGLAVSFVNCGSMAIPTGTSVGMALSSGSAVLNRIRIMTCNIRGGMDIAKTVSDMNSRRLVHAPMDSIAGILNNRVANLAAIRCSNRPNTSTTSVLIHNGTAFNSSSPLVRISKIRQDVASVSPGRVRDIAILGSTSTATIFNVHNTGNIVLVAAGHNGRKGPGVSFSASTDVLRPAGVIRRTGSCRCTAFCGRLVGGSKRSRIFSPAVIRGFHARSSPVHFPSAH